MKYIKLAFIIIFIGSISLIGILTLGNNNEVSELEARNLETFSAPKVSTVLDGTWEESISKAFSDQLEFRDFFVSTYYKVTLKTYTGDVAEGTNNQLYSAEQKINDWDKYEKKLVGIADEINKTADALAEQGRKFIFVSIPRKDAVILDYLPKYYTSSDEIYVRAMEILKKSFNENVYVIDAYQIFTESETKGYDCYFSTDHHITFYGGMRIYDEIIDYLEADFPDINRLSTDDYAVEKIIINGSYNRLIGQKISSDPEPLFISLKEMNFTYDRYELGKKSNRPIWGSARNTYGGAYMDGDNEETVVITSLSDCPNVMFFGTSFTNILEALMVPNCHTVASVDYRYNETGKSVIDYAEETDADYVIYIPSISTNAFSISQMRTQLGK